MKEQPPSNAAGSEGAQVVQDLKASMCGFLDAMLAQKADDAAREFGHLYERARNLVHRKISMRGTKSETRDLLAELIFSRMRRAIRDFLASSEGNDPRKCAEWVMTSMYSVSTLTEFSSALDRAILEMSAPREYSFAGMADFISIEEVIQLLGSGNHVGCLTFEKPDNRIDIYLKSGRIAFLDVHRMIRRVLPGNGAMNFREISEESIRQAEQVQSREGIPLFVALERAGCFKGMDFRSVVSELGVEAFHEFLLEPEAVFFSYLRMPELPDFVLENDISIGVTPILLEGNKRLDDWRSMLSVFPDQHGPIHPSADMYAKIGSLELDVLDIKLLSLVNGENSPKMIGEALGLPVYEAYQHLVRLAQQGVIPPPGGDKALTGVTMSVEDSMKLAFEALDANDDSLAIGSALDNVFGGGDGEGGGLFGDDDDEQLSLDFLKSKQ